MYSTKSLEKGWSRPSSLSIKEFVTDLVARNKRRNNPNSYERSASMLNLLPSRKRVNSKEEFPVSDELLYSSVDVEGSVAENGNAEVVFLPRKILSEFDLNSSTQVPSGSFRILSKAEVEALLKNSLNRKKAIQALTASHCLEALSCLLRIFDWEIVTDESKKQTLEEAIMDEFVQLGSSNEICLPEHLRSNLESGQSTLLDVKAHLLNDLRFNQVFVGAITA
jgi:hypothetical protein